MARSKVFSDAQKMVRVVGSMIREATGRSVATGAPRSESPPTISDDDTVQDPITGETKHRMLWGADKWNDPDALWIDTNPAP